MIPFSLSLVLAYMFWFIKATNDFASFCIDNRLRQTTIFTSFSKSGKDSLDSSSIKANKILYYWCQFHKTNSIKKTSVTHSAIASCATFCSYHVHILTSSVIYYWTDARQHWIYLLSDVDSWNSCIWTAHPNKFWVHDPRSARPSCSQILLRFYCFLPLFGIIKLLKDFREATVPEAKIPCPVKMFLTRSLGSCPYPLQLKMAEGVWVRVTLK